MTILCGTDFSDHAGAAARIAAGIARRLGVRLKLVHALDAASAESSERAEPVMGRLRAAAEDLAADFGVGVDPLLAAGDADERLVGLASELAASLLVTGTLGAKKQHRWLVGSVAERTAQSSPIPVLVVREGAALEAWTRGRSPLRVLVAVEPKRRALAVLQWARELRRIGPCELAVAWIVWPPGERHRAGPDAPLPLDRLTADLEQPLLAELRRWAGAPAEGPVENTTFLIRPGWGRVDSHLTQLAAETGVDLVVVGTHQRAGVARIWQGSVSRGVLHGAATSVACVPLDDATAGQEA